MSAPAAAAAPDRSGPDVYFSPPPLMMAELFLLPKVLGLPLPQNEIKEGVDIYGADPDHLPIDIVCDDNYKWAYFFVEKNDDRRTTPGGHWDVAGDEEAIVGKDDRTMGFKKYFLFRRGSPPDEEETDWGMEEFRINPDLEEIKNSDVQPKDYVAVRISMKILVPGEYYEIDYEGSDSSDEDLQLSEGSTITD